MMRRLGITLALAILIVSGIGLISADVAGLSFLPFWAALFFAWPYLGPKLTFNFPKPSQPRKPRAPLGNRLIITAVLAIMLALGVTLWSDADIFTPSFLFCWLGLFFGWPYLSQRLHFPDFAKASTAPASKRPFLWRLIHRTFALAGGTVLVLVLMSSIVFVPISRSFVRARKVHDALHIGMTVPEVLHAAKDCDIFQASSDFPHDDKSDALNIPAMRLGWGKDGTYQTRDPATYRDLQLSEAQAIERLHATLHDGYNWEFRYTYINLTPQHVSFSVVFGPDERVTEVKPIYGWD